MAANTSIETNNCSVDRYGDTHVLPLTALPDLSLLEREPHGMPRNWAFCQGGSGHPHLDNGQWAIKHVDDTMVTYLYPLPPAVTVLVNWTMDNAREDLQRSIRAILGLT